MLPSIQSIGFMSGTSLDGIDVASLTTNGVNVQSFGSFTTYPYTASQQNALRQGLEEKLDPDLLERELTKWHIDALQQFLDAFHYQISDFHLIGFHGQTLRHAPQEHITRALGNGAMMAEHFGIPVVCDFRKHDVALGGWGAPSVPVFHQGLSHASEHPIAFVNLGGIANITYIDQEELRAFDIGPSNSLLNDWVLQHTGKAFDQDGLLAKAGNGHLDRLKRYQAHHFFKKDPPKALDRSDFNLEELQGLNVKDGAATLVELIGFALEQALTYCPRSPKHILLCGGGRKNIALVDHLQTIHPGIQLIDDFYGIDGDAVEAYAFAYLAVRSLYRLPLSFPTTTGCPYPVTGGCLYQPTLQQKELR